MKENLIEKMIMKTFHANLQIKNSNDKHIKYIYCPSGNCLNMPEIKYSNNLLNSQFHYKCVCHRNNNKAEMNLNQFLKESSQFKCSSCSKELSEGKIICCMDCKNIFDDLCIKDHQVSTSHLNYMPLDQNIFNNCIEHKNPFIFRCLDCNKSLCFLDTAWHNDEGHQLEQLRKYLINEN